ncbi:TIGR00730 family Rossman fold protein [Porticoccaceae bacterium]|nr:TIGR00730 family Rossman fold protein [Porticoccaceae bacterium]
MEKQLEGEAWRALRIQAELVDGTEKLRRLGPAVTVFGGARWSVDSDTYRQAEELAARLGREGVAVITGGGPGVMEAANKGCAATPSTSVGLNIQLPHEQQPNRYQDLELTFRYFFVRKYLFVKQAIGFVIFPGGFGTLDELFEALTLVQTGKVEPFPIVLVGQEFWQGLIDWLRQQLLSSGSIAASDLALIELVDTPEEAATAVLRHIHMRNARNT